MQIWQEKMVRKSFPWEDLRHASDTFSFIKATGKECGSYMGVEHPELKKKSRPVSSYLFFCESVLVETVCWEVGGGEEGLQSHKPTG